jgi:hypothetical protein
METKAIPVSEQCAQEIEKINHDMNLVYFYCKGIFGALGQRGPEEKSKPSDMLTWFMNSPNSNLDSSTQCQVMKASEYFKNFVVPIMTTLDESWENEYQKNNKNWLEAWTQFDGIFQKQALIEPSKILKENLIRIDQERTKFGSVGEGVKKIKRFYYYYYYYYFTIVGAVERGSKSFFGSRYHQKDALPSHRPVFVWLVFHLSLKIQPWRP